MSDVDDVKKILIGKEERIYREFRNSDNILTTPSDPFVIIYDPEGAVLDSGIPTELETGVYYYEITETILPLDSIEGIYQAYWQGIISGELITMDKPQYFNAYSTPWQTTKPDSIISSIRRLTGDINPDNYRIGTRDMYWFLADAVEEVQSEYDFGYTLTVNPTSVSWNKTLYGAPFVLFKMKTLILVLESVLHDSLYDGGSVQVGDIKVNIVPMIKARQDNLKRVREDYRTLLYEVKMNGICGSIIDTYSRGNIGYIYGDNFYL